MSRNSMDEGLTLLKVISQHRAKIILPELLYDDPPITHDFQAILSSLDSVNHLDQDKWTDLLNAPASKLHKLKKSITHSTSEFKKRTQELDTFLEEPHAAKALPDEYRRQAAFNFAFQNNSELWILACYSYMPAKLQRKYIRKQSKLKLRLNMKSNDSTMNDTILSSSKDSSALEVTDLLNKGFIEAENEEPIIDQENTAIDVSEKNKIQNTKEHSIMENNKVFESNGSENTKPPEISTTKSDDIPEMKTPVFSQILESQTKEILGITYTVVKKRVIKNTEADKVIEIDDYKLDTYLKKLLEITGNNTKISEECEIDNTLEVTDNSETKNHCSEIESSITLGNAQPIDMNLSLTPSSVRNNYTQKSETMLQNFQNYPQNTVENVTPQIHNELNKNFLQKSVVEVKENYLKAFLEMKFDNKVGQCTPENVEVINTENSPQQSQKITPEIYETPPEKFENLIVKAEIKNVLILDNSEDFTTDGDEETFYDCMDEILEENSMEITSQSNTLVFDLNKHKTEKVQESNTTSSTEILSTNSLNLDQTKQNILSNTESDSGKKSSKIQGHYTNFETPKNRPIFKRRELPFHLRPQSEIIKEIVDMRIRKYFDEPIQRTPSQKRPLDNLDYSTNGLPEIPIEKRFPKDHRYTPKPPKRWCPYTAAKSNCTII